MKAFENEQLISESGNRQVRLTTYRLRYHEAPSRNSNFTSIMLDKISSIELTYTRSSIWLLFIGIITVPIIIGLYFIYIYFASKKHVVFITPDGGKPIVFETKGMKREFLEDFIDKVEAAAISFKTKSREHIGV